MRFLLLFSILLGLSVNAKGDLNNFKIVSAEVLNYQDGDSVLIGNVEILYGAYTFKAPKVYVDSDSGKPKTARFTNGATLSSESLDISAPIMEVSLADSLFKCYSDETGTVETRMYSKNNSEPIALTAWYQEFNLDTGFAKANGRELSKASEYDTSHDRVKFITKDLNVDSDSVEMETEKNAVAYVDFIGNVVAKDLAQRTEANELFYFPEQDLVKAQGNVKILYINETKPSYIFSDIVVYEREKSIFSAMSTSLDSQAELLSDNTRGHARQIIMTMNEEKKPDLAILTGNAYAQYGDKSILGHEVLLNIQDKTIETIVGRPHTQILKTASKALKKTKKGRRKGKEVKG